MHTVSANRMFSLAWGSLNDWQMDEQSKKGKPVWKEKKVNDMW